MEKHREEVFSKLGKRLDHRLSATVTNIGREPKLLGLEINSPEFQIHHHHHHRNPPLSKNKRQTDGEPSSSSISDENDPFVLHSIASTSRNAPTQHRTQEPSINGGETKKTVIETTKRRCYRIVSDPNIEKDKPRQYVFFESDQVSFILISY